MKSSQINFFFMPSDILEIDAYIRNNDLLLVSDPMPTKTLRIVDSISTYETELDKKLNKKYIIRKSDKSNISIKHIKEQGYYLVNETPSPCIEVLYSNFDLNKDKTMNRGRFYYNRNYYDENTLQTKDEGFIQFAADFFKWIKKNFKNVKLEGYEDFLVSERTLTWIKSGGVLLENYNLVSKFKKENTKVKEKAIA